MASKRKKILAIILAAVTAAASVPTVSLMAASAADAATDAATTDASATDTGSGEEETAEEKQNVSENGQVIMDGSVGKVDESEWITINDYEMVAESDTYRMYYYEPRFSIILEDKATGKLIESTLSDELDDGNSNASWNGYMKSGVVLTAIIGTISTYQVDMVNTENTVKTKTIDNGISAQIYFKGNYNFGLTVEVTLEGSELVVHVPNDSIVEDNDGVYISSVSLFPFMGYTFLDNQNGYMLVPDGNGALINLDNKEGRYSTGFSQMIYGNDEGFEDSYVETLLWEHYDIVRDANLVLAPIFGMAHLDDQEAYLAVVEDGATRASIEVQPNGATVNYNRCFAKFIIRNLFTQPLNNSSSGGAVITTESKHTSTDLTVRYLLLSGENANYSGMAVAYRNYLLDNGLVEKRDTSYRTRADFLGTDRESFLFGTRAVTVTTVDNIEEIYKNLQGEGVESLLTIYKGWQKGGLYNTPITKYKADSHIGGTGALTDLIEDSASNDYDVYLYNDALDINAGTNTMTFNAVKMINKRTLSIDTHQQVYDTFYYQLPKKAQNSLDSFTKSYTKKGVENLAVAGISNKLFSYSSKGSFYGREDTADVYADTVAKLDESTNLVLEQPFAYLWNSTEAFLDMPLGTSDYMYLDEEVPFLSMVLKGIIPMYSEYVNFEANKAKFFLEMVESGVYPSFYLTYENSSALIYTNSSDLYSTQYSTYRDTLIQYDKEFRELESKVDGACIIKHEKLDNGVVRVTYDNGAAIYVNYTENDVTVDGLIVGAMSYKVGDAQ